MASEWLRIMLDEIARKRDDARRAEAEEQRRRAERDSGSALKIPSSAAPDKDRQRLPTNPSR